MCTIRPSVHFISLVKRAILVAIAFFGSGSCTNPNPRPVLKNYPHIVSVLAYSDTHISLGNGLLVGEHLLVPAHTLDGASTLIYRKPHGRAVRCTSREWSFVASDVVVDFRAASGGHSRWSGFDHLSLHEASSDLTTDTFELVGGHGRRNIISRQDIVYYPDLRAYVANLQVAKGDSGSVLIDHRGSIFAMLIARVGPFAIFRDLTPVREDNTFGQVIKTSSGNYLVERLPTSDSIESALASLEKDSEPMSDKDSMFKLVRQLASLVARPSPGGFNLFEMNPTELSEIYDGRQVDNRFSYILAAKLFLLQELARTDTEHFLSIVCCAFNHNLPVFMSPQEQLDLARVTVDSVEFSTESISCLPSGFVNPSNCQSVYKLCYLLARSPLSNNQLEQLLYPGPFHSIVVAGISAIRDVDLEMPELSEECFTSEEWTTLFALHRIRKVIDQEDWEQLFEISRNYAITTGSDLFWKYAGYGYILSSSGLIVDYLDFVPSFRRDAAILGMADAAVAAGYNNVIEELLAIPNPLVGELVRKRLVQRNILLSNGAEASADFALELLRKYGDEYGLVSDYLDTSKPASYEVLLQKLQQIDLLVRDSILLEYSVRMQNK